MEIQFVKIGPGYKQDIITDIFLDEELIHSF